MTDKFQEIAHAINQELGQPQQVDSPHWVNTAEELAAQGKLDEAISVLSWVVAHDHSYFGARCLLSSLLARAPSYIATNWFTCSDAPRCVSFESHDELELLGGLLTINVVLYGTGMIAGSDMSCHDMHRRCLMSIVENTPADLYELRLGLNEVDERTYDLVAELRERGISIKVWSEGGNIMLFPRIRQLCEDPFPGNWIIWVDDDSFITSPNWLYELLLNVHFYERQGFRQFGNLFLNPLKLEIEELITSATWYRGRTIEASRGTSIVNFCTGGFHAVSTQAIRELNWPDPRIVHLYGDILLSSALHQFGYKINDAFTGTVQINAAPSRFVEGK